MPRNEYCRPEKDGNSYEGFHLKALKAYDTEYEAQQVANTYDASVFYCEWGDCWHISGNYRNNLSVYRGIHYGK